MADSPSGEQRKRTRMVHSYDVFLHFYEMLDGPADASSPASEKPFLWVDTRSFLS